MVNVFPDGVIVMFVPAASVTLLVKPLRLVTRDPAGADVVWTVPSGNFTPPVVVSIMPTTVSFELGADVPIPTFALFPRIRELLCETIAFAPSAVAFVRL